MTFLLVALLGATVIAQPPVRSGRTSIPRSRAARRGPAATRTGASHRGRLVNGRCERVVTEGPPGDEPDRVYATSRPRVSGARPYTTARWPCSELTSSRAQCAARLSQSTDAPGGRLIRLPRSDSRDGCGNGE